MEEIAEEAHRRGFLLFLVFLRSHRLDRRRVLTLGLVGAGGLLGAGAAGAAGALAAGAAGEGTEGTEGPPLYIEDTEVTELQNSREPEEIEGTEY